MLMVGADMPERPRIFAGTRAATDFLVACSRASDSGHITVWVALFWPADVAIDAALLPLVGSAELLISILGPEESEPDVEGSEHQGP